MLLHSLQELFMVQKWQFETYKTMFKIKAIGNKEAVNKLQNNLQTQLHMCTCSYSIQNVVIVKFQEVCPTCTVRAVFLCRPFKFKDRHFNCHILESVKRLIFFLCVFYVACLKQRYCLLVNCYSSHCERCSVLHAWQNPSMLKEIIQSSPTERTRTVLLIAKGSLGSI